MFEYFESNEIKTVTMKRSTISELLKDQPRLSRFVISETPPSPRPTNDFDHLMHPMFRDENVDEDKLRRIIAHQNACMRRAYNNLGARDLTFFLKVD